MIISIGDLKPTRTTDALVLALIRNPDDMAARLALADAYEEAGVQDLPVAPAFRNALNSGLSILRGPGKVQTDPERPGFVSDEVWQDTGKGHFIFFAIGTEAAALTRPDAEQGTFDLFADQ